MRGGTGQLSRNPQNFRIVDSNGREVGVDASTHAFETIDYVHHEIHGGSHFYVAGYVELNDTETLEWHVTTPATDKEPHMVFSVESSGICGVDVFEGATATGGESITPVNNNRRSTKSSILTVKKNPTSITVSGELIDASKWGAGGNKLSAGGGGVAREDETILKSNTEYLYRITSGANSNIISFKGSWYEHTPKG